MTAYRPLLALLVILAAPAALAQADGAWEPSLPGPARLGPPPSAASSSPPGAPGGAPSTPGAPAQSVPLDGGLGLLALAGGAYAVRRLRER